MAIEKRTLTAIVKDNLALEQLILENEGEVCTTLEAWMQINETNLVEKVDGYKNLIDHLEKGAEYFAEKAAEATKLKKSYEGHIQKLKDNLKWSMQEMNLDEIKGLDHRYKLASSKPRVEIYDETLIPDIYKRVKTISEPDKEAIANVIELGIGIPGARLIEGKTLRCYPNKK